MSGRFFLPAAMPPTGRREDRRSLAQFVQPDRRNIPQFLKLKRMDLLKHKEDTLTDVFGTREMRSPAPTAVSYTHLTLPTTDLV